MKVTPAVKKSLTVLVSTALVAGIAGPASAATVTKPSAKLTASTVTSTVGKALSFDAHTSKLPKGDKLKTATIVFGDGSKKVTLKSLTTKVKHTYATAGKYVVAITLTDVHGKKVTAKKTVTIGAGSAIGTTTTTIINTTTTVVQGLPFTLPIGLSALTRIAALGLTPTQLQQISTALYTPLSVLPSLPVGYLKLLPAADLTLPAGATLPGLPGLAGLPDVTDLLAFLPNVAGLPISLPTTASFANPISTIPSTQLSSAQVSALAALFSVPVGTVAQLPLVSVFLLPGNLLQLGTGASAASFPLSIPAGLSPTKLISELGLSADTLVAIANQIGVPASLVNTLPVGFLKLLPAVDLAGPGALPALPGVAGVASDSSLAALVQVLTSSVVGLPVNLPVGFSPSQALGSLISLTQATSLSSLMGVPVSTVSVLPVDALTLLPSALYGIATATNPTPTTPVAPQGLPITVPSSGLTPTTLVSSLGLTPTQLAAVAALLDVPSAVLPSLPVGFLKLLPASASTLPAGNLPGLPGAGLANLATIALPTGLAGASPIGDLPTTVLGSVQLLELQTIFGVTGPVLAQLPQSALSLLPASLLSTAAPLTTLITGLSIAIPGTATATTLVSSLGLTSGQLSSASALVGIPVDTLKTLPVGVLKLLPAGDLTGSALPALPGLGSLPLVGNVVAMLLSGLPVALPTSGVTGVTSLTSALSALQLTTLSTVFGISPSVLATLPVKVLGLLPTGYVSNLPV